MKIALLALATLPLIGASAASAQAPDWNKGTPLSVTMTNRGFVPSQLRLRSGAQYVITFRNRSDRAHTFTAKEFFAQARVAPGDQAWVSHNEVELDGNRSARLHIVAPTTPGAVYYFRSTRIQDAAQKMKGEIYVR